MRKIALMLLFVVSARDSTIFAESPEKSAASSSFRVYSHDHGPPADAVLKRCELLRAELCRIWLTTDAEDVWRPRCEIVLHSTRAGYLHAVGRGAGQTSGSSLIRFEQGRMLARRIDLVVDKRGNLPALPHELTHVVLADRFAGRQPPRWLDEGIATMADSIEKQMLHRRDCQSALRGGTALRVNDILNLEQFTSSRQVAAFYGQSLSLVYFLTEQNEPQRIIDFAEAAMEQGYDRALKSYYDIEGVGSLERKWRKYASTSIRNEAQSPVIAVGHQHD